MQETKSIPANLRLLKVTENKGHPTAGIDYCLVGFYKYVSYMIPIVRIIFTLLT